MSDPRRGESASMFEARATDRAQASDRKRGAAELEPHTPRRRQPRYAKLLDALLTSLLTSLLLLGASPLARHWIGVIVSNVCILGGIVAAPVVSMVAWVGLALPTHALLHQIAPVLVATSLVWFFLAIVGAHALRLDQRKPE